MATVGCSKHSAGCQLGASVPVPGKIYLLRREGVSVGEDDSRELSNTDRENQHFYNVPVNDPLSQSNVISWHGLERLREFADFSWCTGSGYVLRREALLDIGGFPTSGLTEDVHLSINMMTKGWKTAYVPEALQHGLIPDTYYAHLKQFVRWVSFQNIVTIRLSLIQKYQNIGGCQLGLNFGFYLDRNKTGQLTTGQRMMGLFYATGTMVIPVLTTINQICTPLRFALGTPLAFFFDTHELRLLLQLQCAVIISTWLHELHFAVYVGYRAAVQDPSFSMWMSPCQSSHISFPHKV
jgi:cellulose synthase/poly-beta-1,6-N-acetylglucosamine synthase-like glycosyltransferase